MNANQANVRSFQALLELQSSLSAFRSEAQQTLDRVNREIRRAEAWLDERQRHGRRELERAQDSSRSDRQHLRHAEEELNVVLHWRRQAQEAAAQYHRQAVRLQHFLHEEIPKAESFLARKFMELEAYRDVSAQSGAGFAGFSSTEHGGAAALPAPEPSSAEEVKELLLQIAAENPTSASCYPDYLQQLSQAVDLILSVTPDALGLLRFSAQRDMKAGNILKSRLANRNRSVSGFLYELLGTAALITSGSCAGNGGRRLFVQPETDRLDFEIKLDPKELPGKRKSVEADVLIYRRVYEDGRWIDGQEIGVDFKHALHGTYSGRLKEFQEQVEGIKNVIRTGQIHEFHFVSNGRFSGNVAEVIRKANAELAEGKQDFIFYHEGVIFHGKS